MFVACGIWCVADVSSVSTSSAQSLLIKPVFSLLAYAEKNPVFFSKLVFQCFSILSLTIAGSSFSDPAYGN